MFYIFLTILEWLALAYSIISFILYIWLVVFLGVTFFMAYEGEVFRLDLLNIVSYFYFRVAYKFFLCSVEFFWKYSWQFYFYS